MATIVRAPLIQPPSVKRGLSFPVTVATNLLVTTLAVVVAAPFTPARASLPEQMLKKPSAHVAVLPVSQARLDLATLSLNPFPGESFPDRYPQKAWHAAQFPVDHERLSITTLSLNPFVPELEQVPNRRAVTRITDALPSLNTTTLAAGAVQAPFFNDDWPNPQKRRVKMSAVGVPPFDRSVDQAIPDPFVQGDWPNPIRTRPVQQPQIAPVFDRTVQVQPAPFAQEDWPNPIRRIRPIPPMLAEGVDLITLAHNPFAQDDWQNPTQKRVAQQTQVPPVFDRSVVVQAPFAQADWPNPIRTRSVQHPQIQPVFDRAVVVASPFAQDDWPNPMQRRSGQAAQSFPVFDRTAVVLPAPFAQQDWPNPVRRITPAEWGTQLAMNYEAFLAGPPLRVPLSVRLRHVSGSTATIQLISGGAPTLQHPVGV